ncbi:MAG: sigma-70 family RNA polymerase sigma factor [Rubripirellula sp.]
MDSSQRPSNSTPPNELSITRWFHRLREGDDAAAELLWQHYFPRLVTLARDRFGAGRDPVYGADDAAQSVFHLLCRGAKNGRYERIEGRVDLWRLLVTSTRNKVIDQVRASQSTKRGGGVNTIVPEFEIQSPDPTPEMLAILDEQLQRLLAALRDDVLRKIAIRRLEGHSNAQIASEMEVSERTIERKLNLIRGDLEKLD